MRSNLPVAPMLGAFQILGCDGRAAFPAAAGAAVIMTQNANEARRHAHCRGDGDDVDRGLIHPPELPHPQLATKRRV